MNNNFSTLSPTKQLCTMGPCVTSKKGGEQENQSTVLGWIQSPFYQFDCLSPAGSTMSFAMTSPPCHNLPVYEHELTYQNDNSFSPSIFSPVETTLLKRKDLYKDSSSTSDILGNMDLPNTYSMLDSPHNTLWESLQNTMMRSSSTSEVPLYNHISMAQKQPSNESSTLCVGIAIDGQQRNDTSVLNSYPVERKKYKLKKLSSTIKSSNKKSPQSVTMDIEANTLDIVDKEVDKKQVKVSKSTTGKSTVRKKKNTSISPDSSLDNSFISIKEGSPEQFSIPSSDLQNGVLAVSEIGSTVKKIAKCSVSSAVKPVKIKKLQYISQDIKTDIFVKTSPSSVDENGNKIAHSGPTCNCKKSKCLKLYCDCFAVLSYCDPLICHCIDCCNIAAQFATREEAIKITRDRNIFAFKTKINDKEQHSTGCHCKNSQCLKKYCECYTGAAFCGSNCKCQSCLNYNGSMELTKARNSANETSEGLMNSLSKKRKESPSSVSFLDSNNPYPNEENTKLPPPFPSFGNSDASESRMALDKVGNAFMDLTNSNISVSLLPSTSTGTLVQVATNNTKIQPVLESKNFADNLKNSNDKTSITKKKTVKFSSIPVVYPFFGNTLPMTAKLVALKCLDYLECKDIYSMSQVNSLWAKAAMDDALWE